MIGHHLLFLRMIILSISMFDYYSNFKQSFRLVIDANFISPETLLTSKAIIYYLVNFFIKFVLNYSKYANHAYLYLYIL